MDRYSSDYLRVSVTILLKYIDHVCSCILSYSDQLRDIEYAKEWELLSIKDYQFLIGTCENTVSDTIMFTQILQNFSKELADFYNKKYVSPHVYCETFEKEIFEKEKMYLSGIFLSGKKNGIFISEQAK